MTRAKKYIMLTLLSFLSGYNLLASHIYGIDFYYTHISGYNYEVNMDIYGDCANAVPPNSNTFQFLASAAPLIEVYNGSQLISSFRLSLTGPGVEVTPVCAALKNSTVCKNLSSTIPGVVKYHYSAPFYLGGVSKNWSFKFDGDLGNTSNGGHLAGRATTITNISAATVIAMYAKLDNSQGPNSSPVFTTLPTPFYCVNVPQNYNPGAVDVNGDSLAYALIPGAASNSGAAVIYTPPATPTTPLTTTTGSFSFSSTTGQLNFTPSTIQRSLVVQEVREYRNGTVVGTCSREMTFIIVNNCTTSPATNKFDSGANTIRGASLVNTNTVYVCYKTDTSRFRVSPINPTNDTIEASISGLPAGAVASILNNNSTRPLIDIDWNLPGLPPGNYNFFVTYKSTGCPLTSVQTNAYTVAVIRPNELFSRITAPTQCFHKAGIEYTLRYGTMPRKVVITQGGTTIAQYVDSTGLISDSLAAGSYVITITSQNLTCPTTLNLRVVDSGVYPNTPGADPIFYCLNDPATPITAKPDSGAILNWYTINGSPLMGAPTPRTDTAGIFLWLVSQQFKVCRSLTDTLKVYVTKRPIADFTLPSTICEHDTATIQFTGTIGVGPILEYFWTWGDAGILSGSDQGPWRVYWFTPGKKTVKLTVAENKCRSEETKHELTVQPSPYAGFFIGNETCQFDTLFAWYNSKPFEGQKYLWTFQDADTARRAGAGPYSVRWYSPGQKRVTLQVDLNGCLDTRSTVITIHPAPDARIVNAPGPVCIGDKIYLQATGGATYTWSPKDSLLYAANGELYAQILKPIEYKVLTSSEYGCLDSASIRYDIVEPCCQFSYPNAFTPNGDGRNDRYRVVTYGNHLRYELSIYNNWGQRVYYGLDAEEGWDGNFRGKPCEMGTYFYYLNATCYTGRQETHKGDLMLIR